MDNYKNHSLFMLWLCGLTIVLMAEYSQRVGLIPGQDTCVLEQGA